MEERHLEQQMDSASLETEKQNLEKVRAKLWKLKKGNKDAHLEDINPDELTGEDLVIADKFMEGKLSESEFDDYSKDLKFYFSEQREKLGNFDEFHDSRANLKAWISNKNRIIAFDSDDEEKPTAKISEESIDFTALREQMRNLKESGRDSSFKSIEIDKVPDCDLIIFDKVVNGLMVESDREFLDYKESVGNYLKREVAKNGKFKILSDSRANFLNAIMNKIAVNEYFKRHPERKA